MTMITDPYEIACHGADNIADLASQVHDLVLAHDLAVVAIDPDPIAARLAGDKRIAELRRIDFHLAVAAHHLREILPQEEIPF